MGFSNYSRVRTSASWCWPCSEATVRGRWVNATGVPGWVAVAPRLRIRDPDDPPADIGRAAVEDRRQSLRRALKAHELADDHPQLLRSQQRRELRADRKQPLGVEVADDEPPAA
jgi:hypothetical protein